MTTRTMAPAAGLPRRGIWAALGLGPWSAWLAALALGAVATAQAGSAPDTKMAARPNILWISVEDISADLGCYGDSYARSPHIDALAARGTRYTRAFTVAGVCAPSRSSIITAMYPCSIGTHHMRCRGVPPPTVKCFTEALRAAGYFCTNNSKTDYNFDAPITAWDRSSNTAHWRDRPDPAQPFFAVVNLTTSHESQIRLPEAEYQRRIAKLPPDHVHDPAKAVLPPYYPDTPIVRRDWARYHDMITFTDRRVAEIVAELDADGLAANTIILFWSDHGRGLPRCKRWLYDGGTHVPLIVVWPDALRPAEAPPGQTCDRLVSLMDLGPTVQSLAGIRPDPALHGQAFLGPYAAPPRHYVHAARDRMDEAYDIIRSVRDSRWRYIRNFVPDRPRAQHIAYAEEMPTMQELRRLHKLDHLNGLAAKPALPPAAAEYMAPSKPHEELYDGDADPHNVVNLAGDPRYAAELVRLRAELQRWMADIQDLAFESERELWQRRRPDGVWAVTAVPTATVRGDQTAVEVTLACQTPGASLAWTSQDGPNPHWRLYTGVPLRLDAAAHPRLRVRAIRLGYRESPELIVPLAAK